MRSFGRRYLPSGWCLQYAGWDIAKGGSRDSLGTFAVEMAADNPETIYESKVAVEDVRDLLFLESDYKIRFAISSFLEGLDTRAMYRAGVELGYFPSHSYARNWMRKARDSGAFAVYVETLR
jgi:hypothetical protein